jgi:hypothetical protein
VPGQPPDHVRSGFYLPTEDTTDDRPCPAGLGGSRRWRESEWSRSTCSELGHEHACPALRTDGVSGSITGRNRCGAAYREGAYSLQSSLAPLPEPHHFAHRALPPFNPPWRATAVWPTRRYADPPPKISAMGRVPGGGVGAPAMAQAQGLGLDQAAAILRGLESPSSLRPSRVSSVM